MENQNNINFSYDGNYLVAEINQSIVNYQLEMLVHNNISGLLPAKKHIKNDNTYVYYDVSSKIPLDRAVMRQKMSDTAFVSFSVKLMKIYSDIKEYQFVNRGILLENKYIFLNPITYEPFFVYLPLYKDDTDINEALSYLKNMLVSNMIDIKQNNIMQELIRIFNGRFSSPQNIIEELNKIGASEQTKPAAQTAPVSSNSAGKPELYKPAQSEIRTAQKPASVPPSPVPPKPEKEKSSNKKKKQKEKTKGKNKSGILMLAASALIIIIFVGLLLCGIFNDENGNTDYTSLIAAPILILAVDYLIHKRFGGKTKDDNSKSNKEINVSKVEIKSAPPAPPKPVKPAPIKKAPTISTPAPMKPKPADTTPVYAKPEQPLNLMFDDMTEKTDIFDPYNDERVVFLEGLKGGRIIIDKEVTRIGRLEGDVDKVIQNRKVGRVHADIILRNGNLYVVDLNSTNGTYINNKKNRITGNIEYQLNNNDRIIFANEEYIVHL